MNEVGVSVFHYGEMKSFLELVCSVYGGEERRGLCRVLVGKPEGKRSLGRPRRRWKDRIFRKCDVGVWTGSSWLRIGTGGGHL